MRPEGERDYFFDKPQNVRWVLRLFYAICALLFALDFVMHRHVIHSWENLWGFYAIFGFIACVALVLVAKQMRRAIMRDETYYDE